MDKEKRYVDVDEVIKTIISLTYLDDGYDLLSYEVIHAIEELPTIGVVHSEWIQNDNGHGHINADELVERLNSSITMLEREWQGDPFADGMRRAYELVRDTVASWPPIVRCEDCKHRKTDKCPMRYEEWVEYDDDGYLDNIYVVHDNTIDAGFCDRGEREEDDKVC